MKIKIYKTILPVVLYGREAWPLPLREEYRLRVCLCDSDVGDDFDSEVAMMIVLVTLPVIVMSVMVIVILVIMVILIVMLVMVILIVM